MEATKRNILQFDVLLKAGRLESQALTEQLEPLLFELDEHRQNKAKCIEDREQFAMQFDTYRAGERLCPVQLNNMGHHLSSLSERVEQVEDKIESCQEKTEKLKKKLARAHQLNKALGHKLRDKRQRWEGMKEKITDQALNEILASRR